MVREQRIPLTLSYPKPNAESLAAIQEADKLISKGAKGYSSAKTMFDSMDI
ncbi:type II toxin-antitoxin system RelB/DinJ family antitoxin [Gordonibacter sp.]|uniref:type II toxin-antitoxin system RelB/DinJ family antitoxin n=1 Tax=Gordonibacter sp. TaxID=1968902 RepID=UPI003FA55C10